MLDKLFQWIIDENCRIPEFTYQDEDKIYRWIHAHRMDMKLRERLQQTDHRYFSCEFENKLNMSCTEVYWKVQKQINCVCKIIKAFNGEKCLPIPIKGFTAYALINKSNAIRVSNDIDLFYQDEEKLIKTIESLGGKKISEICSKHEYCKMEFDGVRLEIHRSFPVLSIPYKNVQPNRLQQNCDELITNEIKFADIYANSIYGENESTKNIIVPNYEMTAFILCAHIYKDYLWEPFREPHFKFVEICEIFELWNNSKFNNIEFNNIVKKYNGYGAVTFVSNIIGSFYSNTKLFNLIDNSLVPIRKLMNASFGPYILDNDQDFGKKIIFEKFDDLIESLKPEKVKCGQIYNTKKVNGIYKCSRGEIFNDFNFYIEITDNELQCSFSNILFLNEGDGFFLKSGKEFGHLNIQEYNGECVNKLFGNCKCTILRKQDSFLVTMTIPNINYDYKVKYLIIAYQSNYQDNKTITAVPLKIV